jgi:hypothetical protein
VDQGPSCMLIVVLSSFIMTSFTSILVDC